MNLPRAQAARAAAIARGVAAAQSQGTLPLDLFDALCPTEAEAAGASRKVNLDRQAAAFKAKHGAYE